MEDAVIGGVFLQRQGEQICAHKVLPDIVVGGRVGEVNIGPGNQAFSFEVGGTLQPLKKLEAEDNRGLDLRIEGVEQANVGVDSRFAVGGGNDGCNR